MSFKKTKSYDKGFKQEAVRLLKEGGVPASRIENDLGITNGLLRRWKKALDKDNQNAFPGSASKLE